MRLTIDTFAWIELIRGSSTGDDVAKWLYSAEECFVPAVGLAEVAFRCQRDGLAPPEIRRELSRIVEAASLVPVGRELAIGAAVATEELRLRSKPLHLGTPGLADGMVLASARRTRSKLLTGDRHFEGLPETIWLGT